MARFLARFDSGSPGWGAGYAAGLPAPADYFELRKIGNDSASGALLRDGLITSRSALSADVYADLDNVNKDGALGTYFPPNAPIFSTDTSTFVSWSTAYTSSVDGIKTPTTNRYAEAQTVVNYSLRPTASITSSQASLVGPTTPSDPVGASYATYIAATNAVRAVIDAIKTPAGVASTPYTRAGNNPSRTVHSIWHDPDLTYIAWDDFTPGIPQATGEPKDAFAYPSNETTRTWTGSIHVSMSSQYQNDFNILGSASINLKLRYISTSGVYDTIEFPKPTTDLNITVPISSLDTDNNTLGRVYKWLNLRLKTGSFDDNGFPVYSNGCNLYVTISFEDPILKGSQSPSPRMFAMTTGESAFIGRVGSSFTTYDCFIGIGSA